MTDVRPLTLPVQRCCRVGKQIVNVPSFMVRVDSQKHIDFALNSPFGGGRPGRNKRRNLKCVWVMIFEIYNCGKKT